MLPYADPLGIAKANLLARPGTSESDSSIGLAFICHVDTVPYAANWADALSLREVDGHLHGCGSCDVKGALACFLAAVSSLEPAALSPEAALILTADEEIGCKGMERLLAERTFKIHSAIVSEPTSLRPGIAGKGYGLARVTVEGREAHSAFPERGVSAIAVAAQLIVRIQDRFAGGWNHAAIDTLFDPPRTTVNIGVIEGGTAKNIIAGRCTFLVEWRAVPGEAPESFLGELQGLLEEARLGEPRAVLHLEPLRAEAGFSPAPAGPLLARLLTMLPGQPTGISFGSEASRVARIAEEVIVIGPGDMETAHSDRECVPLRELELWTDTLKQLLHA
jgi:acetylornithine deacetylase